MDCGSADQFNYGGSIYVCPTIMFFKRIIVVKFHVLGTGGQACFTQTSADSLFPRMIIIGIDIRSANPVYEQNSHCFGISVRSTNALQDCTNESDQNGRTLPIGDGP